MNNWNIAFFTCPCLDIIPSKTSSDISATLANIHMKTQKPTLPLLSDAKQDPGEFQADETQDEEFSGSNDSDELAGDTWKSFPSVVFWSTA